MTDIVEVDVTFDPVDVGLLGAIGIVFEAQFISHTIEQFLILFRHN